MSLSAGTSSIGRRALLVLTWLAIAAPAARAALPPIPPEAARRFVEILDARPGIPFHNGYMIQSVQVDHTLVRWIFARNGASCVVTLGEASEGTEPTVACDPRAAADGPAILARFNAVAVGSGRLDALVGELAGSAPIPQPAPLRAWRRSVELPAGFRAGLLALIPLSLLARARRDGRAWAAMAMAAGAGLILAGVAMGGRAVLEGAPESFPAWSESFAGTALTLAFFVAACTSLTGSSRVALAAGLLAAASPLVGHLCDSGPGPLLATAACLAAVEAALAARASPTRPNRAGAAATLTAFGAVAAGWPGALAAALGAALWEAPRGRAARTVLLALGILAFAGAALVWTGEGVPPPMRGEALAISAALGSSGWVPLLLLAAGLANLAERRRWVGVGSVVALGAIGLAIALRPVPDLASSRGAVVLLVAPGLLLLGLGVRGMASGLAQAGLRPSLALVLAVGLMLHFQWLLAGAP